MKELICLITPSVVRMMKVCYEGWSISTTTIMMNEIVVKSIVNTKGQLAVLWGFGGVHLEPISGLAVYVFYYTYEC